MGKLIAVVNNGTTPIYIGDQVVVPGNCRHFDEDLVPRHLRPAPARKEIQSDLPPAATPDPIAEAFGCAPDEDLVGKIMEAVGMVEVTPTDNLEIAREGRDKCKALIDVEQAAPKPRAAVVEALGLLQLAIGEHLVKCEAKGGADAAAAAELARQKRLAAFEEKTKPELQAYLRERNVSFEADANKARLVELCMTTEP